MSSGDSGNQVEALIGRLRAPPAGEEANVIVDAALTVCRTLYGSARSRDALPLAQAALARCAEDNDRPRMLRAAAACGLLCADMADLVGAVGYHAQALRTAMRDENHTELSRTWNNIGTALGITGNYELAGRSYQRALVLVAPQPGAVYSRFAANCNLADCCYQLGNTQEGIGYAERALAELTPAFHEHDPYALVLLHRNLVRLHVSAGRLDAAESHVNQVMAIGAASTSPRLRIATEITRASFELARGRSDVALTRLDQVLARAREVPSTLRDTLGCVIRAEEAAGNTARALMRLEELSDHVYNHAIERARDLIEISALRDDAMLASSANWLGEQDKARLVSKLAPRTMPESWKALQRLAVGAAMRMDETGWHGRRVGALTKALALALGFGPLQALEIGLASELHDIGMLSVPEGMIARNRSLNAAEMAIVQRHSEAGAEMLRDDEHPMVFMAREIAKYHHAHWDGEGYPSRVGGKFIPVAARMCAVADAYDAMVCGIGSRPARSMAEALAELQRGAGKQFDPEHVSCFDALIRSESEDLGMDLESGSGMEDFQELVLTLREDRGFV
ncbi:MAG: HD domain-containing phosphohydrolase [Usitatibacter sp.]